MSKAICCVATSLAISVSLMMPGCSVPQATTPVRSRTSASSQNNRPDTSKLSKLMDESIAIMDKYELDSTMLEYTKAISKYGSLLHDDTATQKDINNAVDEITRLRDNVTGAAANLEREADENTLPTYQEMIDSTDKYKDQAFRLMGSIDDWGGGENGNDVWVKIQWNDSGTKDKVVSIRIPRKLFNGFTQDRICCVCVFEGLDERGVPEFLCKSYETGLCSHYRNID